MMNKIPYSKFLAPTLLRTAQESKKDGCKCQEGRLLLMLQRTHLQSLTLSPSGDPVNSPSAGKAQGEAEASSPAKDAVR